jgi:myo-inositol-1(or 4)-monophosphatase
MNSKEDVPDVDIDFCAQVGIEAAKEAGKLQLRKLNTRLDVTHKGVINLVTEADLESEKLIVELIRRNFPTHSILAEENHSDAAAGDVCWVIDPLDGTTNYAHGFPLFTISIGLQVAGDLKWGAVYCPVADELFTARKGAGAFCNEAPIHVSNVDSLSASLLVTGFPYDIRTDPRNNLDNFCAFAMRSQGVRRTGSAALDFCWVASGRVDGFWELKLNPWDCAAGYLIVSEAGGTLTNFRGEPASIYGREVVASNALIHMQMLDVLNQSSIVNRQS